MFFTNLIDTVLGRTSSDDSDIDSTNEENIGGAIVYIVWFGIILFLVLCVI